MIDPKPLILLGLDDLDLAAWGIAHHELLECTVGIAIGDVDTAVVPEGSSLLVTDGVHEHPDYYRAIALLSTRVAIVDARGRIIAGVS